MPYKDPARNVAYWAEYQKRPERRAKQKAYREAHPERVRSNPVKRRSMLKKRYGITDADYQAMLESQGGRCAICGSLDPRGRGWFCVDHDHVTGRVRGLLCAPCNAALGVLERPAAWIEAAFTYLQPKGV